MPLDRLIQKVKAHPEFHRAGMLLCHNGVVRKTSRDGREVSGLRVSVDEDRLAQVLAKHRTRAGIVDIQVEIIAEKDLSVGDDVMYLLVAGDIRDNVIPVLNDTLNDIKSLVTRKTEVFVQPS